MFADDVLLYSRTSEELQKRLGMWRKALEDRGMKISRKKTVYFCAGEKRREEKSNCRTSMCQG